MGPTDVSFNHSISLQEAAKVTEWQWCKSCQAHLTLVKSIETGFCCCCRYDHSENPW